jgi:uncharacterized protein
MTTSPHMRHDSGVVLHNDVHVVVVADGIASGLHEHAHDVHDVHDVHGVHDVHEHALMGAPAGTRPWTMARLASLPLTLLVLLYRKTISPLLGPVCRWHPSCSTYALGALETHGPLKGIVLIVTRLLRCTPLSLGGINPVPQRRAWRSPLNPDGSVRTRRHHDVQHAPAHDVPTREHS